MEMLGILVKQLRLYFRTVFILGEHSKMEMNN